MSRDYSKDPRLEEESIDYSKLSDEEILKILKTDPSETRLNQLRNSLVNNAKTQAEVDKGIARFYELIVKALKKAV